jgi:chromosome segregation ATPase
MTLTELKGKYARLRDEIDWLEGADKHSEATLARLQHELDQIDSEFSTFRRLAETAPTLREVLWTDPLNSSYMGRQGRAAAR